LNREMVFLGGKFSYMGCALPGQQIYQFMGKFWYYIMLMSLVGELF